MEARAFLRAKILSLAARARRLAQVDYASVGIRPQDLPYAPSPAHFQAANDRLAAIDGEIERRLRALQQTWEHAPLERVLHGAALVEREIDRARRAWGLFFEVFSQRGRRLRPSAGRARRDRRRLLCGGDARGAGPAPRLEAEAADLYQGSHSPARGGTASSSAGCSARRTRSR